MLVLGISGSPRKNGNTDFLVNKALEGAEREDSAIKGVISPRERVYRMAEGLFSQGRHDLECP
ncbi:MAG: NAD(P)H-dependent oxidoreductase [Methanomassiliicoccales archaeon]